jgi:hydroxymethylpyrimidine/phosphomethylpyrimidine kinase
VTGGHLERVDEYLLTAASEEWVRGERVETTATHGTGCAFSSALLAGLVARPERSEVEQVRAAKEFVRRALETAVPFGRGRGPMNLWGWG